MKIKKIATISLCALAATCAAALALPRHVTVERVAVLDVAPDRVIELAASNAGYQRFNPYKDRDPNLEVDLFGPASGVGSGFHFASKDGVGQQVVAHVTPQEVTFAIDLGPMGQPTQAIAAVAVDGATEVTWRMDMDLGLNPLARVMGLFMDGMVGPNFERGLANIADVAA